MVRTTSSKSRIVVHKDVVLDGRLALFHRRQKWLAVADLHFGYELSQRAAGNLFPLWGMASIEARLGALLADYHPKHLILLGDLVHDRTSRDEFFSLVRRLNQSCQVILIAGNHDREIRSRAATRKRSLVDSWRSGEFYFHHGDTRMEQSDAIEIIGHHHPAGALRDGTGLRLKLPAFVQGRNRWIMPAFSPWAAGLSWSDNNGASKIWLCSPQRVFEINGNSPAF